MVKRFDSVAEFAGVAKATPNDANSRDEWYGCISHIQAYEKAMWGDDSYVAEAEKLMDKLDANVGIPTASWEPSVYGAYPIVPEYLAGSITPMRHRVESESDSSPIAIYVSTTCSAMIDSETMLKRGTAILALVLKMQAIRPIEIYLLAETHGVQDGETLLAIKINTKPLDIAVAAFTLCHVGFARHLTYGYAKAINGFDGRWPNKYSGGGKEWEKHVREVLGMGDNDLYVPAATAWDELVARPVEWVNAQVAKFVGRED